MLDQEFTNDIQKWLDSPREQRDLAQGALMLLRLNRNRFLHAHIVRHYDEERLEKELTKHLRIRLKGLTQRQAFEPYAEVLGQFLFQTLPVSVAHDMGVEESVAIEPKEHQRALGKVALLPRTVKPFLYIVCKLLV